MSNILDEINAECFKTKLHGSDKLSHVCESSLCIYSRVPFEELGIDVNVAIEDGKNLIRERIYGDIDNLISNLRSEVKLALLCNSNSNFIREIIDSYCEEYDKLTNR